MKGAGTFNEPLLDSWNSFKRTGTMNVNSLCLCNNLTTAKDSFVNVPVPRGSSFVTMKKRDDAIGPKVPSVTRDTIKLAIFKVDSEGLLRRSALVS
jgi:hypothetical protein